MRTMCMRWILTEDTGSGYDLLKKISDNLIADPVTVKSPKGEVADSGGNSLIYCLFEQLVESHEIISGDIVYIMLDRLVLHGTVTKKDIASQEHDINKCKVLASNHGIKCTIGKFLCIEEPVLSFKYLPRFCLFERFPADYCVQLYLRNVKLFTGYGESFGKRAAQNRAAVRREKRLYDILHRTELSGATLEKLLSALLSHLTCQLDAKFTAFKFTKSEIGPCWDSSCEESKENMTREQKTFCQFCYITHVTSHGSKTGTIGIRRLALLVKQSKLMDIVKALDTAIKL